jgi:hypothetical protein
MKKVKIFVTVFFFIGSTYIFPIMWCNGTDCTFNPNECNQGGIASLASSLRPLIIEGAEHFYNGVSVFMDAIKLYESSNFIDAKVRLAESAALMRLTSLIYNELYRESLSYDYNRTLIKALESFNYDEYHATYNLVPFVFQRVRGFLKAGDIRGVYKELEALTSQIATDIESLDPFQIPQKEILWRINQQIVTSVLFGQYVAEIVNKVK